MNRKLGLTLTLAAGLAAWGLSGTMSTPVADAAANKFIGAAGCGSGTCHGNAKGSNEMKMWQDKDPHAGAFEKLSDEKATKIATAVGEKDASKSTKCLGCHSTGNGLDMEKTNKVDDGVTCEACHGAGSAYKDDKHQKDRAFALANGLTDLSKKDVRKTTCDGACHSKIDEKMVAAGHPKPTTYDDREAAYTKFAHWKKK